MQFCHRVPASPLDSFIESIWVYQNDPRPYALERVMPTGTAQLIESLWGSRRAATLRERLLECRTIEAALDAFEAELREMWRPPGPHPAVGYALAAFDRTPSTINVARVTDTIGLSAKRFIERFKREVGVTPKRYCRIRRFQRALTLSHRDCGVDWTRVAMDCGYFDQAHFIRDFRSFAGITPTAYQSARTSFQNHVKFLQSATGGI